MIKRITFWLECSRWWALPLTVVSWFVAFVFALKDGGNPLNGLIALIGVCCTHLATNLFDDYFDYKILSKAGLDEGKYLKNAQNIKCRFIIDKKVTLKQILRAVAIFCAIALVSGIVLTIFSGWQLWIFAAIGAAVVFLYSKFTYCGLGELAVLIVYGPALFGGVYFVMTKNFSPAVFAISIASAFFALGLLYAHTFLDFNYDKKESKKTLCYVLRTRKNQLRVFVIVYSIPYLIITSGLLVGTFPKTFILTYLAIPYIFELFLSLKKFSENKSAPIEKHWWNFPMENWAKIIDEGSESFMFRVYQARNIVIYFSILLCVSNLF